MNAADVLEKAADALIVNEDRRPLVLATLDRVQPNYIVGQDAYDALSAFLTVNSIAHWEWDLSPDAVRTALRSCAASLRAKP